MTHFLKRTINYWSKTNYRVIIADGSANPIENTYLKYDNVSYYHIKEGLVERILFQAKLILLCLLTRR